MNVCIAGALSWLCVAAMAFWQHSVCVCVQAPSQKYVSAASASSAQSPPPLLSGRGEEMKRPKFTQRGPHPGPSRGPFVGREFPHKIFKGDLISRDLCVGPRPPLHRLSLCPSLPVSLLERTNNGDRKKRIQPCPLAGVILWPGPPLALGWALAALVVPVM